MGYGDVLGLGNQSLADFLQTADVGDLRNKYFSTIDSAGNDATTPPELDQGNLLWQGILPTLATALLTKGKSLAFSGPADTAVLANEQKRATEQQKMSVDAKLKAAGLLGDELTKRETLAASAAQKNESLKQSMEIAKMNDQTRRDIASESNDTKITLGQMLAANAAEARKDREANTKFQQDAVDERLKEAARKDIQAEGDRKANAEEIGKTVKQVRNLESIFNQEAPSAIDVQAGKQLLAVALHGTRPSAVMAEHLFPSDVKSIYQSVVNKMTAGDADPLSDVKLEDIRKLIGVVKKNVGDSILSNREEILKSGIGSYLKKSGEYDSAIKGLYGGFGIESSGPQISPDKNYKTPNGTIIQGSEALQRYGNNPAALGLLQEAL